MADMTDERGASTPPRITLPPVVPPTPEELERRRALFVRVMKLREEIGPIGISVTELLRDVRGDAEFTTDSGPPAEGCSHHRQPLRSPGQEAGMSAISSSGSGATLSRIAIPEELLRPATAEELARRREAIDRMLALREAIGPLPISTAALVREVRDELDEGDE